MRSVKELQDAELMVANFLANGGKITKIEDDPTKEYSKFAGKTKSHLDYADKVIGETILIKHEWELKTFNILGVKKYCIKQLATRTKRGYLVSRFKFNDGSIYSQSYITKMINSGKAIIINEAIDEEII